MNGRSRTSDTVPATLAWSAEYAARPTTPVHAKSPYVEQLLAYRGGVPAARLAGLVLEVKGDFCRQVRELLARHGRAADYVEVSLDSPYRYNPLHNDLDAYALAYGIATLSDEPVRARQGALLAAGEHELGEVRDLVASNARWVRHPVPGLRARDTCRLRSCPTQSHRRRANRCTGRVPESTATSVPRRDPARFGGGAPLAPQRVPGDARARDTAAAWLTRAWYRDDRRRCTGTRRRCWPGRTTTRTIAPYRCRPTRHTAPDARVESARGRRDRLGMGRSEAQSHPSARSPQGSARRDEP
jgi:hypothetical protein